MSASELLQQVRQLLGQGEAREVWQLLCESVVAKSDPGLLYYRALAATQCDEIEDAHKAVADCLARSPRHPGAHFQRGLLALDVGDTKTALAAFQKAVEYAPGWAEAHYNVALLQERKGNLKAAESGYRTALKANPGLLPAANNLANVWVALGKNDLALNLLQQLVAGNPGFADAWCSLGRSLLLADRLDDAAQALERALELRPGFGAALENLGEVREKQQQPQAALAAFAQALELSPDNDRLRFRCAVLRGENPQRPPDSFVRNLFDGLSGEFDQRLVEKLGYRFPYELEAHLVGVLQAPASLDVLDIGCGTGLVGIHIKPWARHLMGVDLSSGMVVAARKRGVYDQLLESTLQDALADSKDQCWDLVIAGDVFVYVGDLNQVLAQTRRVLRPDGRLLFSIECCADEHDYLLQPTGRYAHSEASLRRLAAAHGFAVEYCRSIPLRKEWEQMLEGMVLRFGPLS